MAFSFIMGLRLSLTGLVMLSGVLRAGADISDCRFVCVCRLLLPGRAWPPFPRRPTPRAVTCTACRSR